MGESLDNARRELIRVEHLLYVSLKYTRTVDVLRNAISRLVSTLSFAIDDILEIAKDDGKIDDVPTIPLVKVQVVRDLFPDKREYSDYLDFFVMLRKLEKASYERAQEYRRHVTMTAELEGEKVEVTIDILGDYFHKVKDFIMFLAEEQAEEDD